jgi:hypothetical protein
VWPNPEHPTPHPQRLIQTEHRHSRFMALHHRFSTVTVFCKLTKHDKLPPK